MVKKLNPSFVEYFATYLKKLLSNKTAVITAEMFQEQVTNAANVYLNENYGADPSAARAAIAQSAPEAECAKAINARAFHKIQPEPDDRISYYKTQAGIDTVTMSKEQKKNAKTGTSVWDLLNGLTHFSTHDNGFAISDDSRRRLQVQAGGLLVKEFDMSNLVASPF